jgi:DNA primase
LADDQLALIKQANDIVEVIGEYVPLRKFGKIYRGLCPFHDDHNPSLNVDPKNQRFRCWACNKFGDVITFIQERERVDFREALAILARRANIPLRRGRGAAEGADRTKMLDLMKWAEEQFHHNLLESAGAEPARRYLAGRRLSAETIKSYALGYSPEPWEWLVQKAQKAGWPAELLVKVGLIAPREDGVSYYDRFRDRVIFPIRDVRGRTVGFGGRILPSSSSSAERPKYYNSTDTPLFSKSENLYGLDRAREAAEKAGYLAVVEGYTDVLMAHQSGVLPVVATLGTALNARHIKQLKRYVPRVILVFDADAGGQRGVDRALEAFVSEDVELAIATLPAGLDPCDLLVQQGPEPLRAALEQAVDALEFKLNQAMAAERVATLEGRRRAIDEVLQVLALAPALASQAGQVKRELVITRIAQRAGLRPEAVWARLRELQQANRPSKPEEKPATDRTINLAAADPAERQLLQETVYLVLDEGELPGLDQVRVRLVEEPELCDLLVQLEARGKAGSRHEEWLSDLLERFRHRRQATEVGEVRSKLRELPSDGPPPVDLLRRLQGTNQDD